MFQFNPESITRTIEIPPRPTGPSLREVNQAGDIPVERISLTAHFTTQEDTARLNPLSLVVGIGPQLAALEKMVLPSGSLAGLVPAPLDSVADLTTGGDGTECDAVGAARGLSAHPLHLGRDARRAGDDRLDVDRRAGVRPAAQPHARGGQHLTMTAIIPDPCDERSGRDRRVHVHAERARRARVGEPARDHARHPRPGALLMAFLPSSRYAQIATVDVPGAAGRTVTVVKLRRLPRVDGDRRTCSPRTTGSM